MNKEEFDKLTYCEQLRCLISDLDLSEYTIFKLMGALTRIEDELFEKEERIQKATEDLEKTKKYNKNENGLIKVDIDHIEYLLDILKGDNNE